MQRNGPGTTMDLSFEAVMATAYKSAPQRAGRLSEHWVGRHSYCPCCGRDRINRYGNNRPVADFFCGGCGEEFELKSTAGRFGPRLPDGAYKTMIERLKSSRNPNLLLLSYNRLDQTVVDFLAIPKHFFVQSMISARPPLGPAARRAGWVGCTISIGEIPKAGRIYLIRDRVVQPKADVLATWKATAFLGQQRSSDAKGWLLAVLRCIEQIGKTDFTIAEMYGFEGLLTTAYPANQHVRAKIRQQLQVLRDNGYLAFVGNGRYRRVGPRG
jgi:type II restriction enzyme